MKKNLLMILCVMFPTTVTVLVLRNYFTTRAHYRAMLKPVGTDMVEFREAVRKFRDGESNEVNVMKLRIGPEELLLLDELDDVPILILAYTMVGDAEMEHISKLPGPVF